MWKTYFQKIFFGKVEVKKMNFIRSSSEEQKISSAQLFAQEFFLAVCGGVGYYALEILYRGYSHWTMAVCGAVGFCAIYRMNTRLRNYDVLIRALFGALIITICEFSTGCVVNLLLGWNVWDYTDVPFNFLGQICLPFCMMWFILSVPLCIICSGIRNRVFKHADNTEGIGSEALSEKG